MSYLAAEAIIMGGLAIVSLIGLALIARFERRQRPKAK